MKLLEGLDPIIHQHTRLQIMTALYRNGRVAFTDLRDGLGLTPGNLAAHAAKLADERYLTTRRIFSSEGFVAIYVITPEGSSAFERYLEALETIIRSAREASPVVRR